MVWAKWLLFGLLVLPAVEIAVFIAVAAKLGILVTILVTMAISLAGVTLIRSAGALRVSRLRTAVAGGVGGQAQVDLGGLAVVLAGFLLAVPGFITDLLGLLLLVPATRHRIGAWLRGLEARSRRDAGAGSLVDLDPDEWHRVPDKSLDAKRGVD